MFNLIQMKMTPKQKLQKQRNDILQSLYELTGDSCYLFKQTVYPSELQKKTILDFENEIKYLKELYEEKDLQIRRGFFFATPEGKEYKEIHEGQLASLERDYNECLAENRKYLEFFLQETIGTHYRITSNNKEMSFLGIQKFNDRGHRIFGYDFEVRFDREDRELRVHVGTMGSFNATGPMNIESRKLFYIEFARFLQDEKNLETFKTIMKNQRQLYDTYLKTKKELENKLNNPFS